MIAFFMHILKRFLRYPIHDEIDAFVISRRRFMTVYSQKSWLYYFVKVTGVQYAHDITEHDIKGFVDALRDTRSEFSAFSAQTALRIFMSYIKQRDILVESMKKEIEKKKVGKPRNEKMRDKVTKLKAKGLTIRQIATLVERGKSTVHEMLTT